MEINSMGIHRDRSKVERFFLKVQRFLCIVFVVLPIITFVAWVLVGFWMYREIPFDANQWKQAGVASDIGIRYRMVHNLRARIEQTDAPNFADLRQPLGPPHPSSDDLEPQVLEYYLGASYRGPFITNTWDIRLSFDDNQQLVEISIYPGSS